MDNQEDYKSLVNEHYKKQAKEHNLDLTSTMPDQNIRKKELENIVKNGPQEFMKKIGLFEKEASKIDFISDQEISDQEFERFISKKWLKKGGNCLMKVFQGADFDEFLKEVKRHFKKVKVNKPKAVRSSSFEVYLVCEKKL